jgi:dephospho-CoA kinase
MAKLILGFTGEIASGKGTASKYVMEKYGAPSYRFSTMLRDVLKRLYLEPSRENMQNISTVLRQNFGEDLMAKVIFHDAKDSTDEIVVIDGIRRLADITYLKELPSFKLVYVEANLEKRYERITKRGENPDDNSKTIEQFKKDHEAETELQITGLKEYANYVIDNNEGLEFLYNQVDKIISENK